MIIFASQLCKGENMNIITIDDEQSALNILTAAVKDVVPHAEIRAFRNPLDALEFMKKQRCEIVFLDIQMREMNGVVLARKLKEIYPKVNIVFVTGYAQYTGEAFGMHASGYVYKPVTPEKIKIEMEKWCPLAGINPRKCWRIWLIEKGKV